MSSPLCSLTLACVVLIGSLRQKSQRYARLNAMHDEVITVYSKIAYWLQRSAAHTVIGTPATCLILVQMPEQKTCRHNTVCLQGA